MKLATISALTALLVVPSLARINYGKARYNNGKADNAIWIDGETACQYVYLGPDGQNPCTYNGGYFTLGNGFKYQLRNCGQSNFQLYNGDGSFNSNAHTSTINNAGKGCNNQYGAYHVDQQFGFY